MGEMITSSTRPSSLPMTGNRLSFPSAVVCGYILRRRFCLREFETVLKSPASLKTFALGAAAALLLVLTAAAPAGRAQEEAHQRPRRVTPAPTPAAQTKPAPKA